jgi:hypothetical protein
VIESRPALLHDNNIRLPPASASPSSSSLIHYLLLHRYIITSSLVPHIRYTQNLPSGDQHSLSSVATLAVAGPCRLIGDFNCLFHRQALHFARTNFSSFRHEAGFTRDKVELGFQSSQNSVEFVVDVVAQDSFFSNNDAVEDAGHNRFVHGLDCSDQRYPHDLCAWKQVF